MTTFFYLFCGCFGYGAFGNATPGNLLTGFGFYEPYWLVAFGNACIILYLVGAYQNNLCDLNHWGCNFVSLLQPSSGSARSHKLLAIGYIFSSRNVLATEENWSLD
ncbi:unnamed protein product [Sphenostylis stenocarpa]|uniref:Amino acid transporter transmembrane domain-containing protein n=1 Tax=Sphenostylis stenocarpa TaxID=92480 RepID=A0AA86SHP8_9FABA|nr:unnamed protein product [Sphenostylis stenocarpa]